MALPKITGDNPETVTVVKDAWTLIAQSVNSARIRRDFNVVQNVFVTYVKTGDAAPADLDVPKWRIMNESMRFEDSATARDIYVYPVDKDAEITIEV